MLAPLLFALTQYYRVEGFKKTLQYLVENESSGVYSLTIGSTDIEYLSLSFSLTDVVVSKTDYGQQDGVTEVAIHQIKVSFGSPRSLWSGGPLKIRELSITEPVASISLGAEADSDTSKDPVNIAHEIAQFTPAIVSLFNQFDSFSFLFLS